MPIRRSHKSLTNRASARASKHQCLVNANRVSSIERSLLRSPAAQVEPDERSYGLIEYAEDAFIVRP
jgi:hypothetical protein